MQSSHESAFDQAVDKEETNCVNSSMICGSDISVISNVINAILGVSIFMVPWGFQMSGSTGGIVVVLFIAACSYKTCIAMISVQQQLMLKSGDIYDYSNIVNACLGPAFAKYVSVATIFSCLGATTSYLIFLGRLLSSVLRIEFTKVLIVSSPFLILVSWVRSFHELSLLAGVGSIFVVATVMLVASDNYTGHSLFSLVASAPKFSTDVFDFVGPATFLFTVHYCIMAISSETLRECQAHKVRSNSVLHLENSFSVDMNTRQSTEDLGSKKEHQSRSAFAEPTDVSSLIRPIRIAYIMSCIIVIFHGLTAMAIYRIQHDDISTHFPGCETGVCDIIVLNISPGRIRLTIEILLSASSFCAYPIMLAPAREVFEQYLDKRAGVYGNHKLVTRNYVIRAALVIATVIIAACVPHFGVVLGQIGGLTDASLAFAIPALIKLVGVYSASYRMNIWQRAFYIFTGVWGFLLILRTLNSFFGAMIFGSEDTRQSSYAIQPSASKSD